MDHQSKESFYATLLFPKAHSEKRLLIKHLASAEAIRAFDTNIEHYADLAKSDELFDKALDFVCASKLNMRGWRFLEEPRRGLFVFHNPRKNRTFDICVVQDGSAVTPQYIEASQEHVASSIEEAIKKYQEQR